jgi:hypothetical protein
MSRPFWTYKYTPEEMLEESTAYFLNCDKTTIDKWMGAKVQKPKTLSWLCLWLWVSKDYISEKAKDPNYSETIKGIRMNVENDIEEWILTWMYNATSWIFNLKNNFNWVDKTEVDQNIKAQVNNMTDMPTDELLQLANGNN